MGQRELNQAERERIYLRKQEGDSLQTIANETGLSYECVRKWWRRGKKEGLCGLQEQKRGRPPKGILTSFDPAVRQACLDLKRQHKRWGANRVIVELKEQPNLNGVKLEGCKYSV